MNSLHKPDATHNLVLYFQVHQPRRLKSFQFFDIGSGAYYFDDELNEQILSRVARECYLPTNRLLLNLIHKHPGLRVCFSISGTTIEQFERFAPEVLLSFRDLAQTGAVEFLAETYYHSLACMIPGVEFELQIMKHIQKLKEHFGVEPQIFRNTELIYNNDIGSRISALGFKAVITDGIENILFNRTPHYLYSHPTDESLKIFLRNYRLSDDIAFRYSAGEMTVEKYMSWLAQMPDDEKLVNLALDYETFGEHKKSNSGIFRFLEDLLIEISNHRRYAMLTPSEAIELLDPHSQLFVPNYISWADRERDLSAWLGNDMQRDAFDCLKKLEKNLNNINDPVLMHTWRQLQTSDHFYYMSTKKEDDGGVHSYFSPYCSPYEAFINYMNVLSDFSIQIKNRLSSFRKGRERKAYHLIQ
jgi:alpha-amylase